MKHTKKISIALLGILAQYPCVTSAMLKKKQQSQRMSCELEKKAPVAVTQKKQEPNCAPKNGLERKEIATQQKQEPRAHEKPQAITAVISPVVPAAKKAETITIVNSITDKMITYEGHWAKPKPSLFQVTINQKLLGNNESVTVPVSDGKVTVAYACEFKRFGIMYHQEKKELSLPLPAGHKQASITFCWDAPDRIALQAQPDTQDKSTANIS
ncbi:MAG: hypothetical protein WCE21_02875 [Candidatus Babeliales bacterium]